MILFPKLSTNIRLSNFKQVKNVPHIRDRRLSYFPVTLTLFINGGFDVEISERTTIYMIRTT